MVIEMNNDLISELKNWVLQGNKIAIYCAGLHGGIFCRLLKKLEIEINVFIDNDVNKIGKKIDGISCVSPQEINNTYKIIICTGIEKYRSVVDQAISQGLTNIIDFRGVIDALILNHKEDYLDLLIQQYYELPADPFYTYEGELNNDEYNSIMCKNGKIAVYTSIFGSYDNLYEPLVFPDNIDYYYISDERPQNIKSHCWIDAKTIIPSDIHSPIKRNRYIKMHPHLIFPNYKYSIYVDANVRILKDLTILIRKSKSGISVFQHPKRDCLYYEALTIVNHKRVDPVDVVKQINRYFIEGMPIHFGLPELPFLAREHKKKLCVSIMETWWKEFDTGAQRDQLSFPYALWKNKVSLQDVALLGNCVRSSEHLHFYEHYSESKRIKNDKL